MKRTSRGRCWAWIAFHLAMGASTLFATTNAPSFQPRLPDDLLWPQGRYVYQRNCLVCHGAQGDGRGEMGRLLIPSPRDFRRGIFKYRSTPAGALPADADLVRTIRGGLSGTAMPMFTQLTDREVRAVAEYVKSFSPRWRDPANYAAAVVVPAAPAWLTMAAPGNPRIEKGRAMFVAACAACHGPDGSGPTSAAGALEDSFGQPSVPANLRQARLRSGDSLEAIYRVLVTGIEGTPMPSFGESLDREQLWELVAYIAQLRQSHAPAPRP